MSPSLSSVFVGQSGNTASSFRFFGGHLTYPQHHQMRQLFTQAVDKKRFTYLHRIHNHEESKWSLKALLVLQEMNIGWARNMFQKLNDYSHGCRGVLKFTTSTKHLKTESESRPT